MKCECLKNELNYFVTCKYFQLILNLFIFIFILNLISYFFIKNIKVFQWLSKSTFLSFMTNKLNPNNENENAHKILKYFSDLYNWHLSISLIKWQQTSKKK